MGGAGKIPENRHPAKTYRLYKRKELEESCDKWKRHALNQKNPNHRTEAAAMKKIFETCNPRDEVLRGDLREQEFAAR